MDHSETCWRLVRESDGTIPPAAWDGDTLTLSPPGPILRRYLFFDQSIFDASRINLNFQPYVVHVDHFFRGNVQ